MEVPSRQFLLAPAAFAHLEHVLAIAVDAADADVQQQRGIELSSRLRVRDMRPQERGAINSIGVRLAACMPDIA